MQPKSRTGPSVCSAFSPPAQARARLLVVCVSTYVLSNFLCSSAMNSTASRVRMVSKRGCSGPRITTPATREEGEAGGERDAIETEGGGGGSDGEGRRGGLSGERREGATRRRAKEWS